MNTWGFQMLKFLSWGGGLQCQGVNFLPLCSYAENQLPRSHKPLAPPLPQPHIPTHMIKFQIGKIRHQHIGDLLGSIHLFSSI